MINWKLITTALSVWFLTSLLSSLLFAMLLLFGVGGESFFAILIIPFAFVASLPALVLLLITLFVLNRKSIPSGRQSFIFLMVCMSICFLYGIAGAVFYQGINQGFDDGVHFFKISLLFCAILCFSARVSIGINAGRIERFFLSTTTSVNHLQTLNMETSHPQAYRPAPQEPAKSNILMKATITACLILVLMIPTLLIGNLVTEREKRNETVVTEVSNMWASSQTISGPFIYVPYKAWVTNDRGVRETVERHFWLIPEDLRISGDVKHLIRQKSIYKVMLYRASLLSEGQIKFQLPKDVPAEFVNWDETKICFGLTDFKGIEEKIVAEVNGASLEFTPGLPSNDLSKAGLSAPLDLKNLNNNNISFEMPLKLKGSEQLHFIPLSGNSSFQLSSDWNSPSFDGNNLPAERTITDSGFIANWSFNRANLPFNTLLSSVGFDPEKLAFGVTLLQPTDQYVKTDRSVKYAILVIGLTFALFFIIELLQKRPMHPVQYILIGLALVIFYTLLLSFSEFIEFDLAYVTAAFATVSLITWYSALHFRKRMPSVILCAAMTILYGFIFVLIRLEDTALLIGSIGLFIILAVAMYFSRKVNWYGRETISPAAA